MKNNIDYPLLQIKYKENDEDYQWYKRQYPDTEEGEKELIDFYNEISSEYKIIEITLNTKPGRKERKMKVKNNRLVFDEEDTNKIEESFENKAVLYKGYIINNFGDGWNVMSLDGDIEEEGIALIDDAKKLVDELITNESLVKIKAIRLSESLMRQVKENADNEDLASLEDLEMKIDVIMDALGLKTDNDDDDEEDEKVVIDVEEDDSVETDELEDVVTEA